MIASKSIHRIWILGFEIGVCIIIGAIASNALAAQATLAWDPNTESDLAGYRIHHGAASGSYSVHTDVHNVTTYTVDGLTAGQTYYFALTAYDSAGNESGYSNEVSYSDPSTQGNLSVTPAGNLTSSGSQGGPFSPSGVTYTLANLGTNAINWTASKNQNWVTLSGTGGSLQPYSSTTVTVSINSNANSLSARSAAYTDILAFTNTTNGMGGGNFGVNLKISTTGAVLKKPDSMPWLQLVLEK